MPDVEQVKPQDAALRNSPKGAKPAQRDEPGHKTANAALAADTAGDESACYWNNNKYSDGGQVCDSHRRFECWNGKWVDAGDC